MSKHKDKRSLFGLLYSFCLNFNSKWLLTLLADSTQAQLSIEMASSAASDRLGIDSDRLVITNTYFCYAVSVRRDNCPVMVLVRSSTDFDRLVITSDCLVIMNTNFWKVATSSIEGFLLIRTVAASSRLAIVSKQTFDVISDNLVMRWLRILTLRQQMDGRAILTDSWLLLTGWWCGD